MFKSSVRISSRSLFFEPSNVLTNFSSSNPLRFGSSLRNNNITNPILDNYFQKVTTDVDIVSQPEGYDVYMDLLNDSVQNWTYLGKSPIYNVSVPNLRFDLKFKIDNDEYIQRSNYWVLNRGEYMVCQKRQILTKKNSS